MEQDFEQKIISKSFENEERQETQEPLESFNIIKTLYSRRLF